VKRPFEVFLALGSNQGDRARNLTHARELLLSDFEIMIESSVYETPPWGYLDQPAFLNQVLMGKTLLTPHVLLDFLKRLERTLGRKETFRFGPRVIDIDILLYGNRLIRSNRLEVPHPRLHERAFVLVPLCEIAPDVMIPGIGQSVDVLLKGLDTTGIQKYEISG
jgi:2-amino-4-hydroxy-6-hydroxymethyldihydropteridine diphosphokinase